MDVEKAFDCVEWDYLFYTLQRFGFGQQFIRWIRLLYSSPQASVRTNNNYSSYFSQNRSTRQGCPLSPLLFALAIEPLAIALRSDPRISGVLRCGRKQRVSLYADDLLLYLSDLDVSVPIILTVLENFGAISGYKLNFAKSEPFPLNSAAHGCDLSVFPFKVQIFGNSGKSSDLYKLNVVTLLDKVKRDFDRWSVLPLSLAARISTVKMNTLPRFLHLFQCIPTVIPKSFFIKLDALITKFIWNNKPPRFRKQILQQPKYLGGMALPNFQDYYWASNSRAMQFWISPKDLDSPPEWLQLQSLSCTPSSLSALLHSPLNYPTGCYTKNIVVKSSLLIWRQFRRHFGLQAVPISIPLIQNHLFPPSMID